MAAASDVALDDVCELLRLKYALPEFAHASHDDHDVARSEAWGLAFNVARADDPGVVEGWMKGTPAGSNYQITLTLPWDESAREAMEGARRLLAAALGSPVVLVSARQEWRRG
jgi:hypothetical protein